MGVLNKVTYGIAAAQVLDMFLNVPNDFTPQLVSAKTCYEIAPMQMKQHHEHQRAIETQI